MDHEQMAAELNEALGIADSITSRSHDPPGTAL
jgi:hypothetical protein